MPRGSDLYVGLQVSEVGRTRFDPRESHGKGETLSFRGMALPGLRSMTPETLLQTFAIHWDCRRATEAIGKEPRGDQGYPVVRDVPYGVLAPDF